MRSPGWWKNAVIYEIYPRSFQDTNGDGIGDLKGIIQRLDYLRDLGVDAIWIAPMYPSPQVDFGYDVSDYRSIDPSYGTLEDFDRLVVEARHRHIEVIVDMVLNHTSDRHPWFIEARRDTQQPKHSWYVWNGGRTDKGGEPLPPNSWTTYFGGSSWTWIPEVKEFYYHAYYAQQPDLNWRNPAVETAMFDVMKFWLERGVAGFRLDSIPDLFEDERLRNETAMPGSDSLGQPRHNRIFTANRPEIHDVIRRMRAMVSSYPGDPVLIGETDLPNTAELDRWYGRGHHDELQLPMDTLVGFVDKLDVQAFRRLLAEVYTQVHGSQPLMFFDCHDAERSWDRYGDGKHDSQIAKLVAALLLTAKATVIVYQGEEIGQVTSTPVRIEDVKDPVGRSAWPRYKGRDGERTPMQWNASNPQAGFSSNSHPWLPVSANYTSVNVESELADSDSLLNWHKELIGLRRQSVALHEGALYMLDARNRYVLSFARVGKDRSVVIVSLNMSAQRQRVDLTLRPIGSGRGHLKTLLASTKQIRVPTRGGEVDLPPFAAWIGSCSESCVVPEATVHSKIWRDASMGTTAYAASP